MDEFIVPGIEKRKGDEYKPNIFVDYGAGHCDIESYLKHKPIRDFVVNMHKNLKLNTCDNNHINKVCELRPKNTYESLACR